jgi:threonine dehydratase
MYDINYHWDLILLQETGMEIIHPFDDPLVIAGQGTIALEILRQHNPSDIYAIFMCVGGGGLASGTLHLDTLIYYNYVLSI